MIAINLHTKRIRIRSALVVELSDRSAYIELSELWRKSRWLHGNEPFGYNVTQRTIFMVEGWVLQQTNVHGEEIQSFL